MSVIAALSDVTAELGGTAVLRDVSLQITAGEVVAVVGPNGAGKSSMLRVLAGLLTPSRGAVSVTERARADIPPRELATLVAYLPQQRTIHWPLPVREIVGLGRLPHQATVRATPSRDAAAIDAAMAAMDVVRLAERPVLALSGGEQARVLMARALAQEPRLLIADEPTAGLDLAHQLALADALRVRASAGTACLVALHDLALAAQVAHRVVMMDGGQIVAVGAPGEVLTEARIAHVYGVRMQVITVDGALVFVPQRR